MTHISTRVCVINMDISAVWLYPTNYFCGHKTNKIRQDKTKTDIIFTTHNYINTYIQSGDNKNPYHVWITR